MIKATVKLTMAYKRKQLGNLKDSDVGKLLETFAKVHLDKIYPSRRTRLYITTLGYKITKSITTLPLSSILSKMLPPSLLYIMGGRYEDPSIISYFYLVRDEDQSVMVKASQVGLFKSVFIPPLKLTLKLTVKLTLKLTLEFTLKFTLDWN